MKTSFTNRVFFGDKASYAAFVVYYYLISPGEISAGQSLTEGCIKITLTDQRVIH